MTVELQNGWKCDAIKHHSMRIAAPEPLHRNDTNQSGDPGSELSRMAYDYMRHHRDVSFREALATVQSTDQGHALMRSYNQSVRSDPSVLQTHRSYAQAEHADAEKLADQADEVAAQADARAQQLMANRPGELSYSEALRRAFDHDPALKKRYVESTNPRRGRRR